jgi:hypothetical protein
MGLRPVQHQYSAYVLQVMQALGLILEARHVCAGYLAAAQPDNERARDVLYLDLALTAAARTALKGHLDAFAARTHSMHHQSEGVLCSHDT